MAMELFFPIIMILYFIFVMYDVEKIDKTVLCYRHTYFCDLDECFYLNSAFDPL